MYHAGGSATEHTIRTTATSTGTSHGIRSVYLYIYPSIQSVCVKTYIFVVVASMNVAATHIARSAYLLSNKIKGGIELHRAASSISGHWIRSNNHHVLRSRDDIAIPCMQYY